MKLNKDKRNYLIIGLCAILVVMAVGYTAFASRLTINSAAETTSTWNVRFTNIEVVAADTIGGATDKGSQYTNITDDGLTANFYANLESPNDSITYKIKVENLGTLNAKLTLNENFPSNLNVSFEKNKNHTGLDTNSVLNANDNQTGGLDEGYIYYTVTYNSYTGQTSPTGDDRIVSGSVTLDFVQTSESAVSEPIPSEYYVFDTAGHSIGDSFTPTSAEDVWPAGKNVALKYVLDGTNHITEIYTCTKFEELDKPICLRGGRASSDGDEFNEHNEYINPSSYYLGNQAIILGIKSTFESTVAGGSCNSDSSYSECGSEDFSVYAMSFGDAAANDFLSGGVVCAIYMFDGIANCDSVG